MARGRRRRNDPANEGPNALELLATAKVDELRRELQALQAKHAALRDKWRRTSDETVKRRIEDAGRTVKERVETIERLVIKLNNPRFRDALHEESHQTVAHYGSQRFHSVRNKRLVRG